MCLFLMQFLSIAVGMSDLIAVYCTVNLTVGAPDLVSGAVVCDACLKHLVLVTEFPDRCIQNV
jgi:hypothetical protein